MCLKRGKKGFGSVPWREVIDKVLPVAFPHWPVMPPQGTTERTPEMGVEEACVHIHGAEGVQPDDPNPHTRFPVLEGGLVSTFSGCGHDLLERHRCCSRHLLLRAPEVLIVIPTGEGSMLCVTSRAVVVMAFAEPR
jgi:hypothetical protein